MKPAKKTLIWAFSLSLFLSSSVYANKPLCDQQDQNGSAPTISGCIIIIGTFLVGLGFIKYSLSTVPQYVNCKAHQL